MTSAFKAKVIWTNSDSDTFGKKKQNLKKRKFEIPLGKMFTVYSRESCLPSCQ